MFKRIATMVLLCLFLVAVTFSVVYNHYADELEALEQESSIWWIQGYNECINTFTPEYEYDYSQYLEVDMDGNPITM